MIGRPSEFSEDLAERICDLIGSTPRGLDYICDSDDTLPSARTVHRWLNDNEKFCQSYVRARERQADLLFDQCLEIADDASRDVKLVGDDEREVLNSEFVQRAKLRVETRFRMAGKLAPKKYGDRVTHAGDPDNPLDVKHRLKVDPTQLTDEQLRNIARIRLIGDE